MTAKTSQHLADVLRAAGFHGLAARAEADEFHEFLSDHILPSTELDTALVSIISHGGGERARQAAYEIRMRHHDGEFEASPEESEAWAASEEGRAAMDELVGDTDL